MTRPKHNQDARAWLTSYLAANRRSLEPWQVRALSVLCRALWNRPMTVAELADILQATTQLGPQDRKPIRQIGPAIADWVLSIINA